VLKTFSDVVWHGSWSITGDILAVSGADNKVCILENPSNPVANETGKVPVLVRCPLFSVINIREVSMFLMGILRDVFHCVRR
jgi:hypothetical protein